MSDLDIGTLTGQIELDDQMSSALDLVSSKVEQFAEKFESSFGAVGIAAAAAVTAVAGFTTAIIALGEKGSTIQGVTESFDHLAEAAGTSGEALRGAFSEGLKGTVDDMDIMQSTTKLLGSGMKLTTDQATLMGQAARALGKATGTDATQGLETLSTALMTGRVRTLQQSIGMIDLAGAETAYARQLGLTNRNELNQRQKLLADQGATLQATKAYVDRLGDSELTFKEKLKQGTVGIQEWVDKLALSIANSPHVLAAVDAIGDAIQKAFGGEGQSAIETITGWVEKFADLITEYAPPTIQFLKDAWDLFIKWKDVIINIGEALAVAAVAKWAGDALSAINLAKGATVLWAETVEGVNTALAANPVALMTMGLAVAVFELNKQKNDWMASQQQSIQLTKDQATIQNALTSKVALTAAQWKEVEEAQKRIQALQVGGAGGQKYEALPGGLQIKTGPEGKPQAPPKDEASAAVLALEDKLQGLDIKKQINDINAAIADMGGVSKISAYQVQALGAQLDGFVKQGANIGKLTPIYLEWLNTFSGMKPLLEAQEKATQAYYDSQVKGIQADLSMTSTSLDDKLALNDQYYAAVAAKEKDSYDYSKEMIQGQLEEEISFLDASNPAEEKKIERLKAIAAQQLETLDITHQTTEYVSNIDKINAAVRIQQQELQRVGDIEKQLNDMRKQDTQNQINWNQTLMGAYNASFQQISAAESAYYTAKRQQLENDYDEQVRQITQSTTEKITALMQEGQAGILAAQELALLAQQEIDAANNAKRFQEMSTYLDQASSAAKRLHDAFGDTLADLEKQRDDAAATYQLMAWANNLTILGVRQQIFSVQQLDTAYQKAAKTAIDAWDAQHPHVLTLINDINQVAVAISQIGQNVGSQTIQNIGILVAGIGGIATAWKNAAAQHDLFMKQTPQQQQGQITAAGVSGVIGGISAGASAPTVGSGLASVGVSAAETTVGIAALNGALTASAVAWGAATFGIGAAVVGITAWIRSAQHAAEVQKQLNQQLADTHTQVQQEFGTTGGTLAQAYETASKEAAKFGLAIADATGDASHHSSEDIKRVQDQLAALDKVLQEVAADASKMGLTFADMDPSDAAEAANKAATALEHTFTIMTQAGYKSDAVIKGMAPDLNSWLSQALQAGVKIPAAMQPIIEQLIRTHQLTEDNARALEGLGADGTPSLNDIADAAGRYGLTLDQLGGKVPQLQINDQAAQIEKDFKTLSDAGVDFGTIMTDTTDAATGSVTGMHHAIQDMVDAALKSGDTIPAGMQPIIQSLIDQGQLLDENGNKITDISKLNFEQPIADKIDDLIGKLGEFIDTMTGGGADTATGATTTMANTTTTATGQMTTDWGKATTGINAYTTAVNQAASVVKNFPSFPNPSPPAPPNPAPANPNSGGGSGSSSPQSTNVTLTLDGRVVARSTINTLANEGV